MAVLSKKLSEREQESIDTLAQAAIAENQLVAANERQLLHLLY